MEHKAWLWRRKASERNITAGNKSDFALSENEEQKEKALELERSLQDLKEQLSSARTESCAKDELLDNQTKVAEEAIAGWKKAEEEAQSFKQDVEDVQLQKKSAEERIAKIDAALKECMHQLHASKEEHKNIVNDAATKILREQGKARALEKKLAETNTKLSKLVAESSNLGRILEAKERLIEDLSNSQAQSEADFTGIVARLDSSEKDNDTLKYEVCMLQKELEIRNQDRDFHLKSADASHRQYLESLKKITRLESECQRLRVMVRKRLPGPAAIAKMRNEVETLGNGVTEPRRNKTRSFVDNVMSRDFESENGNDPSSKKAAPLVERLHATEDENKILKEALVKRNSELQSSRIMIARTASKLSQAETLLEELSKGQVFLELAKSSPVSYEMPLTSISEDGGNEDTVSCAESWASALISELEHFRNGKATDPSNRSNISELSLMDDFVEMEKLAIVCVDKPFDRSSVGSGEVITCRTAKESDSKDVESTGKEIVPVNLLSEVCETSHENQSNCISLDNHPPWLQDILRVILQRHRSSKKSLDAIIEEVCVALGTGFTSAKGNPLDVLSMSGNISRKDAHASPDPLNGALDATMLRNEASKKFCESNFGKPLLKLIELIEGIIQISTSNRCQKILDRKHGSNSPDYKSAPRSGHVARVFLWEISELSSVLQYFLVVCNDLLHRKANFEKFTSELASTLDWIVNHCFSLQDVSTIKEGIKKQLHGEESISENEFESGIIEGKQDELQELNFRVRSSSPLSTTSNGLSILSQMEEIVSKIKDENMKLRYQIINVESAKKDLEERLKSACTDNESLSTQLKEATERIASLHAELESGNDLKELIEDQIVNQKLITEDLSTQLTVAKAELNVAHQKFCSLEVELEDRSNCCEELETTCLELQLQLESATAEEMPNNDKGQAEKQLRADWEISAASEKLAECQATILNLGKQLKAMAAPKDASLFDKVISSPTAARSNHHPRRLLDQMQTEDGARFDHLTSPKTKEIICAETKQPPTSSASMNAGLLHGRKFQISTSDVATQNISQPSSTTTLLESFYSSDESNRQKLEGEVGKLVLVPKRQKGGVSLLRKLLSRRKKDSSKKLVLPIGS